MQYRSDIDGLRALAIVSIVIYHASPGSLRGGFLGVDIFFVISGYLITSIIAPKMAEDRFSLLEFYRRRVVRILPALLMMIVLVCLAGCVLLLPFELRALANSALAAAAFASNFYFWGHTDYFGALDVNPLLHSWSLAVEEQFYLVYPLFLLALHRWGKGYTRPVLAAAMLGSALLAWWVARDHPAPAFYLLPTRAWELAMGGLVALGVPRLPSLVARQWVSLAGLAIILVSVAMISRLPTPVPAAIPACAGTALLLAYGGDSWTARLLSLPPLRWLGLVSYSWYLWHWPVINFYQGQIGTRYLSPKEAALTILAGLALAVLSYWIVEQPIRQRFRKRGRPGRIVAAGLAASALVAAGAAGLAAGADHVRPLPPEVARVANYLDYSRSPEFTYQFGPIECHGGTLHFDAATCLRTSATKRNVMVLGDSHAAHLWRAIAERFPNANVMQANSTDCRPLIGTGGARLCREMFDKAMALIAQPGKVQSVVISAQWAGPELKALAPTIRAIRAHGVEVTIIGPGVSYTSDLPLLLARAMLQNDYRIVDSARAGRTAKQDARMRAIALGAGAHYYSLYDQQCPGGQCRVLTRGGIPIQFDQAHLTLAGSRELIAGLTAI